MNTYAAPKSIRQRYAEMKGYNTPEEHSAARRVAIEAERAMWAARATAERRARERGPREGVVFILSANGARSWFFATSTEMARAEALGYGREGLVAYTRGLDGRVVRVG